VIDGFRIAPRTDKWWKYGQVYKYELYMGEENGNWGSPVIRDTLALDSNMQEVHFAPTAGRLVRFRVLSVHDPETDSIRNDSSNEAYSALTATTVKPMTISEFRLLEHQVVESARVTALLSEADWSLAECATGAVKYFHADNQTADFGTRMNGLKFRSGLSAVGESRIDYVLHGDWQRFRVEAGVDDRDASNDAVRFQVYGNGRLLYQSAGVKSGAIAKIEIDVRGVTQLSLRTIGAGKKRLVNWANPVLSGLGGARVGERPE
jgi:alpha-glucosidase